MFPWWPKHVPIEMIPILRSLGRKIALGPVREMNVGSESMHGLGSAIEPTAPLSLKEKVLWDHCKGDELYVLCKVLADGVKQFEMPPRFEAMDEIEIPLKVAEYTQPFPALIVKSGAEYHFVITEQRTLKIGTYTSNGEFESSTMMNSARTIESYLVDPTVTSHYATKTGDIALVVTQEPGMIVSHRFRATLNYLLLCTTEALTAEKFKLPKQLKRNSSARLAKPELYRPQNIELLRRRYDRDVRPDEGGNGSPTRPHWRRAHWRQARVGAGRTERRLVFVKACFIHKELMNGNLDDTTVTYSRTVRGP